MFAWTSLREEYYLLIEQDAYSQVEFIWFLNCRCDGCESVLRSIEKQIQRANSHKEKKQKQKIQVEAEVNDQSRHEA